MAFESWQLADEGTLFGFQPAEAVREKLVFLISSVRMHFLGGNYKVGNAPVSNLNAGCKTANRKRRAMQSMRCRHLLSAVDFAAELQFLYLMDSESITTFVLLQKSVVRYGRSRYYEVC